MQSNDDTGNKSPGRSAESHPTTRRTDGGTPCHSIRNRLTTIDQCTRALLVALHESAGTELEGVDEDTRVEAVTHVRRIRAAASHVGLVLIGPTATMYYSPFGASAGDCPVAAGEELFTATSDDPVPEGEDTPTIQRDSEEE